MGLGWLKPVGSGIGDLNLERKVRPTCLEGEERGPGVPVGTEKVHGEAFRLIGDRLHAPQGPGGAPVPPQPAQGLCVDLPWPFQCKRPALDV